MEQGLGGVDCRPSFYCLAFGAPYSVAITRHGLAYHHVRRPTSYFLHAVSCPQDGYCLAVGAAKAASGKGFVRIAERYTGSHWDIVDRPGRARSTTRVPNDVSCVRPSLCFATGRLYSTADYNPTGTVPDQPGDVPGAGLIAQWDGHHWTDETVSISLYSPS